MASATEGRFTISRRLAVFGFGKLRGGVRTFSKSPITSTHYIPKGRFLDSKRSCRPISRDSNLHGKLNVSSGFLGNAGSQDVRSQKLSMTRGFQSGSLGWIFICTASILPATPSRYRTGFQGWDGQLSPPFWVYSGPVRMYRFEGEG